MLYDNYVLATQPEFTLKVPLLEFLIHVLKNKIKFYLTSEAPAVD